MKKIFWLKIQDLYSYLYGLDGEQLVQAGVCLPCPQGTYRTKGVHKGCIECPPGTTTEGPSSVKRSQCNTPRCTAGQFLVTSTSVVQFFYFYLFIIYFFIVAFISYPNALSIE